ncbi:MAG: uracil-DNA glycosylase [Bacteroidia bacterium]|nr:uracil-DNA glycosylase [Bacteroidia bacterium]
MNAIKDLKLEAGWNEQLKGEFEKPYFKLLTEFLNNERASGKTVFPAKENIFAALNATPFDKVKVVIIGQDPYHGAGQAHGLCFSVNNGVKVPPSLVNIFKELKSDLKDFEIPDNGNLMPWAKEGVLLLNATLTVRASEAGSHQGKGWEEFTDSIIKALSQKETPIVFLLWGKYAQNKAAFLSSTHHKVLTAAHPSPFSAYNGFLGCKHFSKANAFLVQEGLEAVDWRLINNNQTLLFN